MPIFAYILFGLIAITIVIMIIINLMYRNIKKIREAAEDYMYRKEKEREQKEKNPFGEDYFKSSNAKKQNNHRQAQGQYTTRNARNTRYSDTTSQKEETTARRTTTSDGVTIIDDRSKEKKIFTHDDGEYIEFEEV